MSNPLNELMGRWQDSARYSNFGNVLLSMSVEGVRCHTNTSIEFRSPICAFSGLNGTGKTTLIQLAAAVYRSTPQYHVSCFLAKGPLDLAPFRDDAVIKVNLQSNAGSPTPLTLSYNPKSQRWQGYARRQTRDVYYFGVGFFLPLSERRGFVFRNARNLSITQTHDADPAVLAACAQILSGGYSTLQTISVKHRNQTAQVLSTARGSATYSEAHMGCGEGRIHCLVTALESLPPKCLVLLEEPEISLHQRAEYELGKYLVDLSIRRGHQILITTHSERLLRSLPQTSLIHLTYHNNAIVPVSGLLSCQAESLMTEGFDHALVVLVEDKPAAIVLSELLRAHNPHFQTTVRTEVAGLKRDDGQVEAGGYSAIIQAMKTLSAAGLPVAAVLDPDQLQWMQQPADDDNEEQKAIRKLPVFRLPGMMPPEREVLHSMAAQRVLSSAPYGLNAEEVAARLALGDCHNYLPELATRLNCDRCRLFGEMARAYAAAVPPSTVNTLIQQLKECC